MTRTTGAALAVIAGLGAAGAASAQDRDIIIGVSIPAATHGWTGGVVYHAEQAEAEIEAAYPNVDVVVTTSPSATAQVSALEDMTATQELDALVILLAGTVPIASFVAERQVTRRVREGRDVLGAR